MAALVAHRGCAARFPENTVAAQRAALDAGVRWVECDVQLAADRVPIVIHDADLVRTAGDARSVFELDADALARVSVHEPRRLGDAHAPAPVPRLADSVALVARYPGATLFVEVKQESIDRFGLDAVVAAVCDVCAPAADRCVVISFNDDAVAAAMARGLRGGWVLPAWNERLRTRADALAPAFLFTNIVRVPAGARPWPGPWAWAAYDAHDADEALEITARGFDLVESKAACALAADPRLAAWVA